MQISPQSIRGDNAMAKWIFIFLSIVSFTGHANFHERYVCEATGVSVQLWANQSEGQVRLVFDGNDFTFKINEEATKRNPLTSWFDRVDGTLIECCGPVSIGISTSAGHNSGLQPGFPILQIYSPGLISNQVLSCRALSQ
jgi:hypothetical protein